ncbi:MAG TPA: transporter suffix domain-containing protein [Chondromyces sp.]|nr:transporter suffix domain-containing protein [Chondromyces sp.]
MVRRITSTVRKNKLVYNIGTGLIVLSFILWIIPFVVPFFDIPGTSKAMLITGALITAEIVFWIGMIFVGKEAAMKIRKQFHPNNWKRKQKKTKSSGQKED